MIITFPEKQADVQADVAELFLNGELVSYRIPPVTGTHSECFSESNSNKEVRIAKGREIAAYAYGALAYRKNEWADHEKIRFTSYNYLRVPAVLTIFPKRKEFGDLEGAMLVDEDLRGEGIGMKTEVPSDLSGWTESPSGLLYRDSRIVIPFSRWYEGTWSAKNGAVVALFGEEGGEVLEKSAIDSGRGYRPLWRVDPTKIKTPERRVPVVGGGVGGLDLGCSGDGGSGGGCAARVLK